MMNPKFSADLIRALNDVAILTVTDLQGHIIFANEQFCHLSGYSQEELLGAKHNIVNSGTHTKEFFAVMWKTVATGNVWFGEICNRAKDGHLYWLQATVFPIFDEETNQICNYAAIRFDISEKKNYEKILKRRASDYLAALETTDGFCQIENRGYFLEVSDSYCHITGYSRNELLKMNISDMDASDNIEERAKNLNCIVRGDGRTFEMKRRRKDNSTWSAEITATRSTTDNNSIFVFLHDITERKEMEKRNEDLRHQLNHIQKLDSIGRLTAGLAHDFNNILASILGYTEMSQLISDDLPDSDIKTDLKQNLKQVEIAGNRAAELVSKMLTYCRQSTEKKIHHVVTRPTHEVIKEVLKMLRVGLTFTIAIELKVDENTPNIVMDSIELHQVLTNLLVNARDAIGRNGGGKIKLQLSTTTINSANCLCDACLTSIQGTFIQLSVFDNGSGMSKEIISQIFDPFFTTKEVGEGTGLGLSVVSGIVHQSHGHILVASKLGEGTTFKLLFPIITE